MLHTVIFTPTTLPFHGILFRPIVTLRTIATLMASPFAHLHPSFTISHYLLATPLPQLPDCYLHAPIVSPFSRDIFSLTYIFAVLHAHLRLCDTSLIRPSFPTSFYHFSAYLSLHVLVAAPPVPQFLPTCNFPYSCSRCIPPFSRRPFFPQLPHPDPPLQATQFLAYPLPGLFHASISINVPLLLRILMDLAISTTPRYLASSLPLHHCWCRLPADALSICRSITRAPPICRSTKPIRRSTLFRSHTYPPLCPAYCLTLLLDVSPLFL